jgi:hypothetical protein
LALGVPMYQPIGRVPVSRQFDRGVEGLDLFGIAGDIFGVEMADDADPQASDILAEQRPVVGYCGGSGFLDSGIS